MKHVMDLFGLIKDKRSEVLSLAAKHGAQNVRIFGSVARGNTSADSDIDLLVDLEPGRGLLDHAGLQLDLEELLGVEVDVVTEKGLKERIRKRVLAEAIHL